MNFNSHFLFQPFLNDAEKNNPAAETLGDMIRVHTIVPGPADHKQALAILDYFGLPESTLMNGPHARESFWEVIEAIRIKVFQQLHVATKEEWRVNWSPKDKAFCLWYRHRNETIDATRNLQFAKATVLNNIVHSVIRESTRHGFGLFSTINIEPGCVLCILDGQIMSREQYETKSAFFHPKIKNLHPYFFMEWNALSGDRLLVRSMRTKYSYINHSTKPNLVLQQDGSKVRLIADQFIRCDAEFFLDYRCEPLPRSYFSSVASSYLHPTPDCFERVE